MKNSDEEVLNDPTPTKRGKVRKGKLHYHLMSKRVTQTYSYNTWVSENRFPRKHFKGKKILLPVWWINVPRQYSYLMDELRCNESSNVFPLVPLPFHKNGTRECLVQLQRRLLNPADSFMSKYDKSKCSTIQTHQKDNIE